MISIAETSLGTEGTRFQDEDGLSTLILPAAARRHVNIEYSEEVPSYALHNDKVIKGFFGPYRFLSNFFPSPLFYECFSFPSAEHAYQAQKYTRERWGEFVNITAGEAKRLGRKAPLEVKDWSERRLRIMEKLVRAKFEQSPELRSRLLATDGRYLEETNSWSDRFWGVCDGAGENKLGQLLMRLRAELKNPQNSVQSRSIALSRPAFTISLPPLLPLTQFCRSNVRAAAQASFYKFPC